MDWLSNFIENAKIFISSIGSVLPPGMGVALGVLIVSLIALAVKRIFF